MSRLDKIIEDIITKAGTELLKKRTGEKRIVMYDGFEGPSTKRTVVVNPLVATRLVAGFSKCVMIPIRECIMNHTDYETISDFVNDNYDEYCDDLLINLYNEFYEDGNVSATLPNAYDTDEVVKLCEILKIPFIDEEEYFNNKMEITIDHIKNMLVESQNELIPQIMIIKILENQDLLKYVDFDKALVLSYNKFYHGKATSIEFIKNVWQIEFDCAKTYFNTKTIDRADPIFEWLETLRKVSKKYKLISGAIWLCLSGIFGITTLFYISSLPVRILVSMGFGIVCGLFMGKCFGIIDKLGRGLAPDTAFCGREYYYVLRKLSKMELDNVIKVTDMHNLI